MDNYKVDYEQILKNLIMNKCMEEVNMFIIQQELGEFSMLLNENKAAVDAVNDNLAKLAPAEILLMARIQTPHIQLCKQLCEKYNLLEGK